MDQPLIQSYYDEFADAQEKTGVNERLLGLYRKLKKAGLKKKHSVLELGCGVGAFTQLLCKRLAPGQVEAIDLSPVSVEKAQKRLGHKAHFAVGSITDYRPQKEKFDFILLYDILEHVPLESHPQIWSWLPNFMHAKSRICINIPNPAYLEYEHVHAPQYLQILDQPIPISQMIQEMNAAGLSLVYLENWTVWSRGDYYYMEFQLKQDYKPEMIVAEGSLWEKIQFKLRHYWIRWRY